MIRARTLHDRTYFERGSSFRHIFSWAVTGPLFLTVCISAGAWVLYAHLDVPDNETSAGLERFEQKRGNAGLLALRMWSNTDSDHETATSDPTSAPEADDPLKPYGAFMKPDFAAGANGLEQSQPPLGSGFALLSPTTLSVASVETETAVPAPVPAPAAPQVLDNIPLPERRPTDLQAITVPPPSRPAATAAKQSIVATAPPADNRSFFEKLFGGSSSVPGPVLAYANPEDGNLRNGALPPLRHQLPYDKFTAVYDITARVVYMPDGSRLEAHSGLGERLDDPRYVSERMRGATPPHLYELKLRETLFHGVQALRLTPIGEGDVYGRTGLLAHRYMLGPNGDSNGCVSFKDYNAFLQAYMNGQVKRLAVVASLK